jgi:hypothetical protein
MEVFNGTEEVNKEGLYEIEAKLGGENQSYGKLNHGEPGCRHKEKDEGMLGKEREGHILHQGAQFH